MPILKEFELDAPYIEDKEAMKKLAEDNGWEYYQATRYDYDLNWKEKRFYFSTQSRCVTSFYERCFEAFKTNDCWKIQVQCVSNRTAIPKVVGGVYEVQVIYEIDKFFQLSDEKKKITALELLYQGITEILKVENWDSYRFYNAYTCVVNGDFINKWIWKHQKTSPNRKYVAKVLCEHNVYSCDISIIVLDKNDNEIKKAKVTSTKPDEWFFSKYFGELKWLSNAEVALYSKDRKSCFRVIIE